MIELVTIMVLIAVMGVFIAPRLQTSRFDELGFYQETLAAIRHAHKVAIASGCAVRVTVAATGVSLGFTGTPATCGTAGVVNPHGGSTFITSSPSGVSVAGVTFEYDLIGDASVPQDIVITNRDASTRTIRITDETGFAFTP